MVLSEQVSVDGRQYAQYEPGQPVVALPFYWAGRAAAAFFPSGAHAYIVRFFVSLFGAFVTAATVATLYRLVGALGYGERIAVALALLYGLATFAWPYARTFYAEPLTTLALLAAFFWLRVGTEGLKREGMRGGRGGGQEVLPSSPHPLIPSSLLSSGVVAGLALVVKPHAALVLPGLGLYLLGRTLAGADWPTRLRNAARAVVPWGVGFLVGLVPLMVVGAAIYGGPLRTGYSAGRLEGLALPFMTGLYGMVLSSGRASSGTRRRSCWRCSARGPSSASIAPRR